MVSCENESTFDVRGRTYNLSENLFLGIENIFSRILYYFRLVVYSLWNDTTKPLLAVCFYLGNLFSSLVLLYERVSDVHTIVKIPQSDLLPNWRSAEQIPHMWEL